MKKPTKELCQTAKSVIMTFFQASIMSLMAEDRANSPRLNVLILLNTEKNFKTYEEILSESCEKLT